ncbi:MAG: SGNH/GDSL hydrolase family protein [Streptosporangiales bacterium]|nr:SGNH/GDSL hydrolase family protein [Streptosporangiales bacterium]
MPRRRSLRSWFRPPGLAVAAVAGLALFTGPAAADATSDVAERYVALGDSFTSGPLVPNQTGEPLLCLRSDHNYPHLAAEALGAGEFRDVSCGGATTEDMTEPQSLPLGSENAPQFDALTEDTTLVTLGIGGNDIGFADIVVTCGTLSVTDPFGNPCERRFTEQGDELRQRIKDTAPKLAAVLQGIKERAPQAKIVVVGYLQVLPESKGCWPRVPMAAGDVPYIDGVQQDLNGMLAEQAAAHGAAYLDVLERGHDVCAARSDRWVEGIFPTNPAAPVHPNADGMAAVADRLTALLGEDTDVR